MLNYCVFTCFILLTYSHCSSHDLLDSIHRAATLTQIDPENVSRQVALIVNTWYKYDTGKGHGEGNPSQRELILFSIKSDEKTDTKKGQRVVMKSGEW